MEAGRKYIHYCWFGNKKLPRLARKCIKSWKKYLPDYEVVCWSEKNFDLKECPFIMEAYEQKKWAFVADYVRTKVLYEYGGIYFDTDMLVKKDITFLLDKATFVGVEDSGFVNVSVWGARNPRSFLTKKVLDFYRAQEHFNSQDLYAITIPVIVTKILREYGFNRYNSDIQLIKGVSVYPREYFYPLSYDGQDNRFTNNTCMIHYASASWVDKRERRDVKLIRRFGRQRATTILRFGASIKACVRAYGRAIRCTLSLIAWPVIYYTRGEGAKRREDKFRDIINDIAKCDSRSVVLIHEAWMGVRSATVDLFDDVIVLPEIDIADNLDRLVDAFANNDKIKLLFFAAFGPGWEFFARKLKEKRPDLRIKVIWHGSNAMHYEEFDWDRFRCVFELLNDKTIDRIVFVKKSMYEQYRKLGYDVEFLANTTHIDGIKPKQKTKHTDGIRVGIYASGDRWLKNFYNQLGAASLLDNVTVDVVPITETVLQYARILRIKVDGVGHAITRKELFQRIVEDDVVLYASFVECAPMLPLECLELGVPCITGDNHHYWEETPLEEYLVEPKVDNPVALAKRVEKCIKHKDLIIKLYNEWKKKYDKECEETLKKVLDV